MSFDLKSVALSLNSLSEQAEKDSNEKKNYKDDRFWAPKRDDAGNAYAEIRFLPPAAGENVPWVKYWDFGFQGKNGWYFEQSLRSVGKTDPVSEYNREQWNDESGTTDDVERRRKGVKNRKVRTNYVFNIYVINDTANPSNNGKVFLYRTGTTIFNKIKSAMNPEFPDEVGIPVFDFLEGATFKIKVHTENKMVKYDKSGFESPSKFLDGDAEKIEKVYNQIMPLQNLINVKEYNELKVKLYRVLGLDVDGNSVSSPTAAPITTTQSSSANDATPTEEYSEDEDSEEDDDPMAYFKAMAESQS